MGLGDWIKRLFGVTDWEAEAGRKATRPTPAMKKPTVPDAKEDRSREWMATAVRPKPTASKKETVAKAAPPIRRRREGMKVGELAKRLGVSAEALDAVKPSYRSFKIPKRSGGERAILAPEPELKALQGTILHRLLGRLKAHPLATGFEKNHSIVTNAACHVNRDIVVKLDIKDFFTTTSAARVLAFFAGVGWDDETAALLTRLCTHNGGLPQGAPTSPRLSNLINRYMDIRLAGLAKSLSLRYTRYADDITVSGDDASKLRFFVLTAEEIIQAAGYELHPDKLQFRRRHHQQRVTGLVVNRKVGLPRKTRRWLRAVEHRLKSGKKATLNEAQVNGWRALRAMVARQGGEMERLQRGK